MLQSYNNNEQLKKDFLREVEKHRKLDMVAQGTYGKMNGKWKGCAVACSLRSIAIIRGDKLQSNYSNHKDYEKYLGIPEWLARLEDTIFEGLPVEDAKKWPGQFAKAIPVGVNLDPLKWKFSVFLLKENIERVSTLEISDELKKQVIDAIRQVLNVHEQAIKTGNWSRSVARSAAESAESAAESAWSAAESAAWSVAESAESAAWSAESARSAAYKRYAKELLKLLRAD